MKDKIEQMYIQALIDDLAPNVFADQVLRLLGVVGRSESFVCGHPPKRTCLIDGTYHCEECGGKWESIANK